MKKLLLLPLAMLLLAGCNGGEPSSHATGLSTSGEPSSEPAPTSEESGPRLGLIMAASREDWGAGNFTKVEGEKKNDETGATFFFIEEQAFAAGSFFAIHRFDTEASDPTNHSFYAIENPETEYSDHILPLEDNAAYAVKAAFTADVYISVSKVASERVVSFNFYK